jgi:hypothetical protein
MATSGAMSANPMGIYDASGDEREVANEEREQLKYMKLTDRLQRVFNATSMTTGTPFEARSAASSSTSSERMRHSFENSSFLVKILRAPIIIKGWNIGIAEWGMPFSVVWRISRVKVCHCLATEGHEGTP